MYVYVFVIKQQSCLLCQLDLVPGLLYNQQKGAFSETPFRETKRSKNFLLNCKYAL